MPDSAKPAAARWDGADQTATDAQRWEGGEPTTGGEPTPASRVVAMPAAPSDDGWHRRGLSGPLTGQVFGDYEIGTVLGEGGMGMVYRARQRSLGRRVAVKTLSGAIGHEPLQRARFEIEARAASLIQSPHVVAVHAAGSWDGVAYFVMEYVEGRDLGALLSEHPRGLGVTLSLDFATQATRALAAANAKGVVHRDVKPANLLLTADHILKMADFGVSKIGGEHNLTRTGTAVGTPSYVSPEQGRGEATDTRSDLYSLGCVFYEMLTGQKPFVGDNADAVMYQHSYAEPVLPRTHDPAIPEAVQAVVLRCLQKDPAKRYQDPDALLTDLGRIRDGNASLTALMNARYGTGAEEAMRRRLGRRHRWTLPLAAALTLAAIAGGILIWRESTTESRASAQRSEDGLRSRLRLGLDTQQAVPAGARDDLAALQRLVNTNDSELRRWNGKVSTINAIESRLAGLHGGQLPAAATRSAAQADLADLASLVGTGSASALRTEARLAETSAEIVRLRQLLGELDAGETRLDQRERLTPAVDALAALVTVDDADLARWRRRVGELDTRVAALRRSAALDQAAPGETRLDQASAALEGLAALRGIVPPDADELAWRTRLAAHRAELARLRDHLARFDDPAPIDAGTLDRLGSDLTTYRASVLPDNGQRLRWDARYEAGRNHIDGLRGRCADLERAGKMTADRLAEARADLAALRPLLADQDKTVLQQTAQLAAAEAAIAGWRRDLAMLDQVQEVPRATQQRAALALTELQPRQAINDEQVHAANTRLEVEANRIAILRARCSEAERTHQRVSAGLADDVLLLERLLGSSDAEVKRWRAMTVDFIELRRRLTPLDRAEPLPSTVDADLTAFSATVSGDDPLLAAWKGKVQRVRDLSSLLGRLNEVAAVPEQAEAALAELHALVGPSPQEPAWQAKLVRVRTLEQQCNDRLGMADVLLAPDAVGLLDALAAETGQTPAVAAWLQRAAVLAGPGRPRWASADGVDAHGPRAVLRVAGGPEIAFRHVPPGRFRIGSSPQDARHEADEVQVDIILSSGRWMAETEVTQALWRLIMEGNPSTPRGDDLPVNRVSWLQIQDFLARFAGRTGVRVRLPSEAEWEYACRAGELDPAFSAGEPAAIERSSWYRTSSGDGVHRVGLRPPNPLGLYDLLGNVWEWCDDRYGMYPPTGATDPRGGEREERVVRGGCWSDLACVLRAANRAAVMPSAASSQIGFRLVIDAE